MKKLLMLLMCLFFSMNILSNKIKLIIAYEDKEQPPYYLGNGSEIPRDPGVAVEVVKLLEEYIDEISIDLVRFPWSRCLVSLRNNNVDGIFNASYNTDRAQNIGWYPTKNKSRSGEVDVDRRLTTITYSFYKLKNSNISWNGTSFTNLRGNIGAPLGYSVVNDLKNRGFDVEEALSTEANMRKLVANRVSLLALQDVTADKFIEKRREFGNVEKMYPPLEEKPYYLMLSDSFVRSNPSLAQKIWDTVKIIREEKIDALYDKYSDI